MKRLRSAGQRGRDRRRPAPLVRRGLRPVVAAPAQRPDLARAPHQGRIVQCAFRSDQIAQDFDPAARAEYQEPTRRPLPELVAEALTNDETAERRVSSLATATPTSAASSQTSRTRPRPARRHHPRERTLQAATRSARTTNALLPTDTKASVRASVHQTFEMDELEESDEARCDGALTLLDLVNAAATQRLQNSPRRIADLTASR